MAPQLFTIKKRATFVHIRDKGIFSRSKNINIQRLIEQGLDCKIGVGYPATKKILIKCKRNTYYVLIAKTSILDTEFKDLLEELDKVVNVK